jgi:ABC-type amino acid transport substrate-binding protein
MKSLHRIVLAMLTFGIAAGVSAQELTGTLKKIKDTGTITIGYRDASIPFSYLDDSQKPIATRWIFATRSSTQSRPSSRCPISRSRFSR